MNITSDSNPKSFASGIGGANAKPVEIRATLPNLELELKPFRATSSSQISELFVKGNSKRICYILERPYTGRNTRDNPATPAINESEAIMPGRYEITWSWSPAFKQAMMILLDVPGRSGIRIHVGNKPSDVKGCLAPGVSASENMVASSLVALEALVNLVLPHMLKGGRVFIDIKR
jgi:hypothetical protein